MFVWSNIVIKSWLSCLFYLRSEKEKMKIPFDIEDAKQLGRVLDRYKDLYYFEVMTGICLLYLLWVIHTKDAYSTVDSVTYISLFTISCSLLSLTLKMTFRFIYFSAFRRSQYQEVCFCLSWVDFFLDFQWHCRWSAFAQHLALHFATFSPTFSAAD